MGYSKYIKSYEEISNKIEKELLSNQKNNNIILKEPDDKINILLMISTKHLKLNGNDDLNFSLIIKLLEDKKVWKKIRKELYEKIFQSATLNNNYLLLFALYIKKYDSTSCFSEEEKQSEMILLLNLKENLNEKGKEILEDLIIPYINSLIYFNVKNEYEEVDELLKDNIKKLFDNLNKRVENEDYILISDYIFKLFTKKNILTSKK